MKLTINGEEADLPAVWWNSEQKIVQLIDQTKLPFLSSIHSCSTYHDVVDAIKTMKVRGAPAIGATAAYGLAPSVGEIRTMLRKFKQLTINYYCHDRQLLI